ncbi:MAG TPA: hypothetical protein VHZ03_42955, partial [Trebonia sp.]|nr:hypothetical protein [Trebonia sp.]
MTTDRLALLAGLLGDAFAHFSQATPTVVSVKPPEDDAGMWASFEMPFTWPSRKVPTPDDVGTAVCEQLVKG